MTGFRKWERKKMDRKSRRRKCFDLLEKVTKLRKKKEKMEDRRVDQEYVLTSWKK
jgi:hypothetical protein